MKTQEFVLYRNLKYGDLADQVWSLLEEKAKGRGVDFEKSAACAGRLAEMASRYGFEGNLWRCFLAFCLASHENPYSTSCEIVGPVDGTLNELALHDFKIFRELFRCKITDLDADDSGKTYPVWGALTKFREAGGKSGFFNRQVRERIMALAEALKDTKDEAQFKDMVTEFYRQNGVGKFGLNKAFRLREEEAGFTIDPISNIEQIVLTDLIGYESQKKKLVENTEAFVSGRAANNVLLYGDSGTGKSSSIKAVLNEYYGRGLRMIEVYKHQFRCLSGILEQVKDRNYKFIIYMDDLSFEEFELEYKYLKAIIEGGLGEKPRNVLIYATSNRRHLIREKFSDKSEHDDELHTRDTVQEKLSLVARFGVTIYYGSPDKKEFQKIVEQLARRYKLDIPMEELLLEANRWELHHGGLSGRTAAQFITYLLGRTETLLSDKMA